MARRSMPALTAKAVMESGLNIRHRSPDITTFIRSEEFLDRPNLYPRQATLLKIMTLDIEHMTDYDLAVLEEWTQTYTETMNKEGRGAEGINPDIYERILINRRCPCGHDKGLHDFQALLHPKCTKSGCDCEDYRGRYWFNVVVAPIGRRGSKGHIGAIMGAYILHHYIEMGDPQERFGVDRDKRMVVAVFGGKKEQAKANQWRDLYNVIIGGPIFQPYISRPLTESLSVYSKADLVKMHKRAERGIDTDQDAATFEILPKEATLMAARGIASFMLYFDEAAHVVKGVANTPAEDVYDTAEPSLDQFRPDDFTYIPSSPWQMMGLFFDKYNEAIELEADDKTPVYPNMMVIHLPSWGLYKDWDIAHEIETVPGGPKFDRLKGAIQEFDDDMRKLQRANPETFAVERLAQFAAVLDAYLNPARIAEAFEGWPDPDVPLKMQTKGMLQKTYRMHGDPSKSSAAFGFIVGHREHPKDSELPHVVIDLVHSWRPEDYDDHEVPYLEIEKEIREHIDNFVPDALTFDQFSSVGIIQNLKRYVRSKKFPKRIQVYERTATRKSNWEQYESLKTALGLGLVHIPWHEILNNELTFLQDLGGRVDHPTSGPVQTKDIADALSIVVHDLIGDSVASYIGKSLSDLSMRATLQGHTEHERSERHEAMSRFGRSVNRRRR